MGQVKLKLLDQPEMLSKSCFRFFFRNSKATGLIFLLFNIASAQEVPFAIPLYIQCILHGLTSPFLHHLDLYTFESVKELYIPHSISNTNTSKIRTRVGTKLSRDHSRSEKVLKQAGVVHDIKSNKTVLCISFLVWHAQ